MPVAWFQTHLWKNFQFGNAGIKCFAKSVGPHFILENVKTSSISKAAALLGLLKLLFCLANFSESLKI